MGTRGKPILGRNKEAIEFLHKNSAYTLREVQEMFPGCSLEALRSHADYHELPYKRARRGRNAAPNHQDKWVDQEREARLKAERASASVTERGRWQLEKQFDTLARLWGPWVKK